MELEIYYLLLLAFSVHMTWILGKRYGISITLDWFEDRDDIDFDE